MFCIAIALKAYLGLCGMGGLEWLAVGVVMILVGGGLGYCLATFKYVRQLHSAERKREDLQRQLVSAAGRTNPATVSERTTETPPATANAPIRQPGSHQQPASSQQLQPSHQPVAEKQPASEWTNNERLQSSGDRSTTEGRERESQAAAVSDVFSPPTLQKMIEETAARAQSDVHCLIDIDFLRQFAEKYGLQFQDYVSSHVEQVLRETLQALDPVIYRYEGQEFVVAWNVVPGSTTQRLDAVRRTAAQLRMAVEQAFLQIGAERLKLTISLGLSLCEAGITGDQSVARADEALAAAKKAGRNCGYYFLGGKCLPVEPLNEPTPQPQGRSQAKGDSAPSRENLQDKVATKRRGYRERRRHERKPCDNVNLIAPCHDNLLPSMDKFQRVQFTDISMSGFSMIVPTVPATDRLAVALINSQGMIFMAAEVANIRQAPRASGSKPLLIVGCKFKQRLELPAQLAT